MTDDLAALWRDFQENNSAAAREQLILRFSPIVKFVAARVGAGLPRSVDQADLVSYGMFGLIDAIERFETERGFKFETFAIPRIKGAILDELRAMDWVPRSVRSKARDIERAIAIFEGEHGRSPSDEELADQLDITVDKLNRRLTEIANGGIVALDEMRSGLDGDATTLRDMLADGGPSPAQGLEDLETRRMLAEFITSLGDREKTVLTLYYFEGLTMSEIGQVLGVTESRVCQIHAKAILQLRSKFKAATRI